MRNQKVRKWVLIGLCVLLVAAVAVSILSRVIGSNNFHGGVVAWLQSPVSLPAWGVLLISCGALAGLVAATQRIRPSANRSTDVPFAAEFFGVRWRWRRGPSGIFDVTSYCPHCDLQVYPKNVWSYRAVDRVAFRCDEGHWESQEFECTHAELDDKVRRKIEQELRRAADGTSA